MAKAGGPWRAVSWDCPSVAEADTQSTSNAHADGSKLRRLAEVDARPCANATASGAALAGRPYRGERQLFAPDMGRYGFAAMLGGGVPTFVTTTTRHQVLAVSHQRRFLLKAGRDRGWHPPPPPPSRHGTSVHAGAGAGVQRGPWPGHWTIAHIDSARFVTVHSEQL